MCAVCGCVWLCVGVCVCILGCCEAFVRPCGCGFDVESEGERLTKVKNTIKSTWP